MASFSRCTTKRLLPVILSLAIAGCGLNAPAPTGVAAAAPGARASANLDDFMHEVFRIADSDRDGFLTLKETGLLPEQLDAFDKSGDGRISKGEWEGKATMGQILKKLPSFLPFVVSLYGQLDTNKNRLLTMGELETVMKPRTGSDLSASDVEAVFKASDKDTSGALTGDEFQDFYLNLTVIPERGLFKRMAWALLGTYVNMMSRIAVNVALHPKKIPPAQTPAKFGLPFEAVTLQTEDLLRLKAWYIPAATPTDKAVVLLHGRGDSRQMFIRQQQIKWLHRDYNVLAVDLRNHGESEGNVTTFGYGEGRDVQAAVKYVESRGNRRIGLYGISLGAATAIRGAAITPAVDVVVAESGYATVVSAFKGFVSFSFVPSSVMIASAAVARANQVLGIDMTTTEPLTQVGRLAPRPLSLIHGAADQYITPDNSRINFEVAGPNLPKELWIVPGAQHAVPAEHAPVEYEKRLLGFLKKHL